MNFKPTKTKIIVSDITAVILASITIMLFFPFPVQEQAIQSELAEGSLSSAMFHMPELIVIFYLLVLLALYYALIYAIWSLFEKSKLDKGGIKKVLKK